MPDSQLAVCSDCGLIDETVELDEDSNLYLCPECYMFMELGDWADEMMEQYGWVGGVLYVTEENRSHTLDPAILE